MNIDILCSDLIYNNQDIADYFKHNNDLLKDLYFKPKKVEFDKLDNKNYLNKVKKTISLYSKINLKDYVNNCILEFSNDYKIESLNKNLYIIIGFATTTIYSTKYENEDVTVILLESTNSLDDLKMLLAHEYAHWVRQATSNIDIFETCIGERFITEGLACAYAKHNVPNKSDSYYCIVPDETVSWCKENMIFIDSISKGTLDNRDLMSLFFYMYANIEYSDMPVRTGYVYGYLKVLKYMEENNINITDILTVDWETILN